MRHIITDSLTQCNSVLQQFHVSESAQNLDMKTCEDMRLENLKRLIDEAGGEDALAALYGCTSAYIKQMARGYKDSKSGSQKGIGASSARMLESCMKKERGWLDHDHEAENVSKTAMQVAKVINTLAPDQQTGFLFSLRIEQERTKLSAEKNGQSTPTGMIDDNHPGH